MHDKIDYLALERKNHNEGSYNAMVKELVVAIRYVREGIPGTEIKNHMPAVYALEKKLHKLDDTFGNSRREYVQEIMEVLENEPEPDETKSFEVCVIAINDDDDKVILTSTGYSFPQHIIAEEWIKDEATRGHKYVILEVIQPA